MKSSQAILAAAMLVSLSGCAKPAPVVLGKWGFIDKSGTPIILFNFDNAGEFTEKGAIVQSGKRLMRLDATTKQESSLPVAADDKAELPPLPTEHCAEAGKDTYKIMDGENVVFDPTVKEEKDAELPYVFAENGLACAKFGDKYAFLTKDGKLSSFGFFDEARPFHEGRAAVKSGGKWGYINKKGSFVIQPIYMEAGSFNSGLAPVKKKEDAPPAQ